MLIAQGMKRFAARRSIETALRDAGLYRGDVDHEMILPVCRFVVCSCISIIYFHGIYM